MGKKTDLKSKTVSRDKEIHYISIKGSIQQEDVTVINIYVPYVRTSKYIKQILTDLKVEFHNNTVRVRDLKYPTYNNRQNIQTENQFLKPSWLE